MYKSLINIFDRIFETPISFLHKISGWPKEQISEFIQFAIVLLLVFNIISCTFNNFLCLAYIPSSSMEPTFFPNDMTLSIRIRNKSSNIKRGDILVFDATSAGFTDKIYTKRVVGLPGETIEIKDGVTYINDKALDETEYLLETPTSFNFGKKTIPDNGYFMMGDNRNNSADSRYWKDPFLYNDDIIGKTFLISDFPLPKIV